MEVFIVSAILSSMVYVYWGYKISERPIKIEHHLRASSWMLVHSIVYLWTMVLMLLADSVFIKVENITDVSLGYLFIQNGGLVVLVMLASSLFYNYYIKLVGFQYFVERHQWIKKTFFTIVCISLVLIYLIEINRNHNGINLNADNYKIVTIWVIILIQIWIGFGMEFYSLDSIIDQVKNEILQLRDKDERKYWLFCFFSMIFFPLIMVVYYWQKDDIRDDILNFIVLLFKGNMIGTVVLFMGFVIWRYKSNLNGRRSKKKYNNLFREEDSQFRTEYYLGVKYELASNGNRYVLIIHEQKIELAERNYFSKDYIEDIKLYFNEIFTGEYSVQQKDKIKVLIEKELNSRAEMRKRLLKEGWDTVYKMCDEKEREKTENYRKHQ